MGSKKNSLLSVGFILLAACLWGTAGVFVRSLEGILSEMQIVLWRALLSCVIIGVITLIKDIRLFKIKIKDLPWFAASGIVSIVLFNFSYYKTMSLTSLSVSAVLLYTAPFFVILISVFAFKEKLTLQKLFACVCAFIGCCMVSGLFGSEHKISAEALEFVTRFPHLRNKMCEAITDSIRLARLEANGYKVSAPELTDPDDTPKNTLIRAVKRTEGSEAAKARYEEILNFVLGEGRDSYLRGM